MLRSRALVGSGAPSVFAPLNSFLPVAMSHHRRALCTGVCTLKLVKVREMIKRVEADGWSQVAQKGSHRQYKHPVKKGRVTIPGHLGDELAKGTEKSIIQQAQLEAK